jgi:hypothetical protein
LVSLGNTSSVISVCDAFTVLIGKRAIGSSRLIIGEARRRNPTNQGRRGGGTIPVGACAVIRRRR